jgi:hypothetical protein
MCAGEVRRSNAVLSRIPSYSRSPPDDKAFPDDHEDRERFEHQRIPYWRSWMIRRHNLDLRWSYPETILPASAPRPARPLGASRRSRHTGIRCLRGCRTMGSYQWPGRPLVLSRCHGAPDDVDEVDCRRGDRRMARVVSWVQGRIVRDVWLMCRADSSHSIAGLPFAIA